MTLTATRLFESLKQLPQASCCHLAFSGGLDSCVLLHLLAELRPRLPYELRALHVDHGLQTEAAEWQRHCETICESYDIPLDSVQLTLSPTPGESVEAVAREARYQALAACMGEGGLLLTAQHQDDQAETLLLQLLRGSGPAGLAAMPSVARFEPGWLARPLLQVSRITLEVYAEQQGLTWHEDPSNQNLRFDRNFIRHQVMPLLRSRWPAASMTLSRAARFSGELLTLVKEEAEEDLVKARYGDSDTLSITALKQLHSVRLRNLLRYWMAASGATMPNSKKLARIELESVHGRIDTVPLITWGGWEVRRYRDQLFLDRARPATNPIGVIPWSDKQLLELPDGLGRLIVESSAVGIDAARWWQGEVEVRFRRGGERCQPAGQAHHRPLKKLLQAWCVPPWERDRLPLIYLDGVLAAIPGRINCQPFMALPGEEAIQVRWEEALSESWLGYSKD